MMIFNNYEQDKLQCSFLFNSRVVTQEQIVLGTFLKNNFINKNLNFQIDK